MKFTIVGYVRVDVLVEELTKEYVKVQVIVQDTGYELYCNLIELVFLRISFQ